MDIFYRERQLAKERAERERQDMEKRKQKDLELKQKMEKIKELVNTSVDHFWLLTLDPERLNVSHSVDNLHEALGP